MRFAIREDGEIGGAGIAKANAGPVGKTKQAAASGASDIKNDIGGYSIVQAESHEAAAALFADNPHLTMPGATVEVMEIRPMPGR